MADDTPIEINEDAESPVMVAAQTLGQGDMPRGTSATSVGSSSSPSRAAAGAGAGGTSSSNHHHTARAASYDHPKNVALVFVKPHANNDAVRDLVTETLEKKVPGSRIRLEYAVSGSRIERKRLIDNHYAVIARYATQMDVGKMDVPADEFEKAFRESWSEVLSDGRACNALQALSKLGCDPSQLEAAWRTAESKSKTTKLGPGLYMGCLSVKGKSMYVTNGFYMGMRGRYVGEGKAIHAYVLEWDEDEVTWKDFRTKVIGATDPSKAAEGSLRRMILDRYKELGLASEPDTGDNAIHASASPLEGLAERCNWLSRSPMEDEFGRALLQRGIPESTVLEWLDDPTVTFPPAEGEAYPLKRGSLFDDVEDTDASRCMERLLQIYDYELFAQQSGACASCNCAVS